MDGRMHPRAREIVCSLWLEDVMETKLRRLTWVRVDDATQRGGQAKRHVYVGDVDATRPPSRSHVFGMNS